MDAISRFYIYEYCKFKNQMIKQPERAQKLYLINKKMLFCNFLAPVLSYKYMRFGLIERSS